MLAVLFLAPLDSGPVGRGKNYNFDLRGETGKNSLQKNSKEISDFGQENCSVKHHRSSPACCKFFLPGSQNDSG